MFHAVTYKMLCADESVKSIILISLAHEHSVGSVLTTCAERKHKRGGVGGIVQTVARASVSSSCDAATSLISGSSKLHPDSFLCFFHLTNQSVHSSV